MNPKYISSIEKLNKAFLQNYEIYEEETNVILERAKKNEDIIAIIDAIINAPYPEVEENKSKSKPRARTKQRKNELSESTDVQETPEKDIKPINLFTSTKPKRLASQVASVMISKVSHITDGTKLRRPSEGADLLAQFKSKVLEEVVIKREKEDSYIAAQTDNTKENIDTNNVSENEMPPPAAPPKGRKLRVRKIKTEVESSDTESESQPNENERPWRSTRTKRNQNKLEVPKAVRSSSRKKTSDVLIVPDEPIPIIEIDSSIDETVIPEVAKDLLESPKDKNKKKKETKNKKAPVEESQKSDDSSHEKPIEKEISKAEAPKIPEKIEDKKRPKRDDYTSDEENLRAKKRTKKTRTKVTKKAETIEKIPIILIENIKQEKSDTNHVVFDEPKSKPESKISIPNQIDQTFDVGKKQNSLSKIPINETFAPVMNSTYCTSPLLNGTVTIEKNQDNPKTLPIINEASSKANETDAILTELDSIVKSNDKPVIADVTVTIERNPIVEKLSLEKKSIDAISQGLVDKENRNEHWKKPEKLAVVEPQLTDDESDISPAKSIPKTPVNKIICSSSSEEQTKPKKGLKTKAVFSPYANSPVKKRVAAFEKLGSTEKKPLASTRVTRTKTKKILEDKENEKLTKTSQKPNPKFFTPVNIQKLKTISSDLKAPRPGLTNTTSKQNISNVSSVVNETQKSNSAIKLTKTEQLVKAKEKEDDAQKKKMALISAKTEESKRLREERMERAKKIREEKERQKEEKLRARQQMLAEKEEKNREDQENTKKLLAQQAAIRKEQEREEQERLRKLKKQQMDLQAQRYYKENERKYKILPPLPTPDYYDTDDESQEQKPRPKNIVFPEWSQKPNLIRRLNEQLNVPKELLVKYFNIKPITPDLESIFEHIPKAYLRRNSSAVWRTPPRYSMMPEAKNFNYRP